MDKETYKRIEEKVKSKIKGMTLKHFDDLDEFQEFYVMEIVKDAEGISYPSLRTFVKLPRNYLNKPSEVDCLVKAEENDPNLIYGFNCFEKIARVVSKEGKLLRYYGDYTVFPYINSICCYVEDKES